VTEVASDRPEADGAAGLERVACNCCGSARQRAVYRQPDGLFHPGEWFTVVECLDCGLGFVNPRPDRDAIGRYYPPAFFDDFTDVRAHRARYDAEAGYLPAAIPGQPPPRLLDVGCANGDFPRVMRARGWEVEGVEVSANARAIDDFPVHRVPLDQVRAPDRSFDAITAWAVLEHVHDPRAYFQAAGRLLKRGGRFVFLVTNFSSLSSRALFREDVPRHLHFFTEAAVRRYLADAGLVLARAVHSRAIYEMRPVNCLYYLRHRWLGRGRLEWTDLPEGFHAYCRRTGRRGAGALARYAAAHPLVAADRLAAAGYERWQLLARRYGIVIYVAERPPA
jgi:SAM-dependent methyltransferase